MRLLEMWPLAVQRRRKQNFDHEEGGVMFSRNIDLPNCTVPHPTIYPYGHMSVLQNNVTRTGLTAHAPQYCHRTSLWVQLHCSGDEWTKCVPWAYKCTQPGLVLLTEEEGHSCQRNASVTNQETVTFLRWVNRQLWLGPWGFRLLKIENCGCLCHDIVQLEHACRSVVGKRSQRSAYGGCVEVSVNDTHPLTAPGDADWYKSSRQTPDDISSNSPKPSQRPAYWKYDALTSAMRAEQTMLLTGGEVGSLQERGARLCRGDSARCRGPAHYSIELRPTPDRLWEHCTQAHELTLQYSTDFALFLQPNVSSGNCGDGQRSRRRTLTVKRSALHVTPWCADSFVWFHPSSRLLLDNA
jgi:hypothetical protein